MDNRGDGSFTESRPQRGDSKKKGNKKTCRENKSTGGLKVKNKRSLVKLTLGLLFL